VFGGSITTLTNTGTISAVNGGIGISNLEDSTITTLNNSGTISAGSRGISNVGAITTLNNSGTILALDNGFGIRNDGTINTLTNSGTISAAGAGGFGINNCGLINTLTNSGTSSVLDEGYGIFNQGTIDTLTNSGAISVEASGFGIDNVAIIDDLTNSGTISVEASGVGIRNRAWSTIDTLTNSGTISAGVSGYGIFNQGTIDALTNSATIAVGTGGYGIANDGTITTLDNSGTISAGTDGTGIYNGGYIDTLTNSGTISAENIRYGIVNVDTIDTLTNSGTISAGNNGYGIVNVGTIDTSLTNSGTISVGDRGSGIYNGGYIDTLTNSGTISAGTGGTGIYNVGTIDALTNSATIAVGTGGYGITNDGTINTLTNSGTISAAGAGGTGIYNVGTIVALTNSGTISGDLTGINNVSGARIESLNNTGTISAGADGFGIFNDDDGTIVTLTNSGTISTGAGGIGIFNIGTITTLNNAQGDNGSSPSTTALTYSGNLPTNYNVIINSASHYGQLAVTSPVGAITNFGIYGTPFLTSRTYAGVLTNNVTVDTLQAKYDNMTLALVNNTSTGSYDLTFTGASLMGTQQSLVNTAAALQNTYALQNSVLANSFSYDCPVFGEHNVCVSAGGRNTAVSAANGLNNTSALLIAAYRIKPTLRIGAYADQNLSVNNAGSTVNLGNSTPLIGLFGVWNQRIDGTGTEVKVAAAYGQKNTTVNRQIVGLSEPGTGSSNLNSQGAQITAKYGFAVAPDVLVSPYLGMRYTQNNMGGYTEGASSTVTAPLTYAALNTNATTVLAGVGASYRFIPKATAFASAGVETDTNTSNGTYSATGITGLTPVNFNPNPVKTRPTATLGAYYDIVKNQRIGITGIYRQESYQAISTTTVMATYTIGL
jgi:hypothetical protein